MGFEFEPGFRIWGHGFCSDFMAWSEGSSILGYRIQNPFRVFGFHDQHVVMEFESRVSAAGIVFIVRGRWFATVGTASATPTPQQHMMHGWILFTSTPGC